MAHLQYQTTQWQLWQTRVEPRLAAADAETMAAIDPSVTSLRAFFQERKAGSRAFAEAMLTWRSKWALTRSGCPSYLGGREDAYERYVAEQFARLVLSGEELQVAMETCVCQYLARVQAIENDLLVAARVDIEDIPLERLSVTASGNVFRGGFDHVAIQMAPVVTKELGVDAVRECSSFITGDVAAALVTAMATRAGVSSGLMAVGAGASWATLGLSLAGALAADQIVDTIIHRFHDPASELEDKLAPLMDRMAEATIDGDGRTPGLVARLAEFDKTRAGIRRAALEKLILGDQETNSEVRSEK